MRKLDLSIVIPARNAESTLGLCLESVTQSLNHAKSDATIFVVLDRCQDSTEAIAKSFDVMTLLCVGKGRSSARNTGAESSQTTYVLFLDADCFVDRDFFQVLALLLEKNPFDWIQSCIEPVSSDPGHWYFRHYRDSYRKSTKNTFNCLEHFSPSKLPIGDSACVCIKKESFNRVHGFDELLPRFEDRDLAKRFYLNHFILYSALNLRANKKIERVSILKFFKMEIENYVGMLNSKGNLPTVAEYKKNATLSMWARTTSQGIYNMFRQAIHRRNYPLFFVSFGRVFVILVGSYLYWRRYYDRYFQHVETQLNSTANRNVLSSATFGRVITEKMILEGSPFVVHD